MSYLHLFLESHPADQTWDGTDIAKERKLLKERKNDIYPQGRDNCKKFLKECASKGLRVRVKAKKTTPYWTWYYELVDAKYAQLQLSGLSAFVNVGSFDETWNGTPSDVPKEYRLLEERVNDTYPQGRDNCKKFLKFCQEKGYSFKIKAKHTNPYWTWYFEVVA